MDRVRVASTFPHARGAMCLYRGQREHGAKDERIFDQEVPVDTEKAALDLSNARNFFFFDELTNWRETHMGVLTDLEHCHFVCKVKFAMSGYDGIVLARAIALNFWSQPCPSVRQTIRRTHHGWILRLWSGHHRVRVLLLFGCSSNKKETSTCTPQMLKGFETAAAALASDD
jgi:hypothetical protein